MPIQSRAVDHAYDVDTPVTRKVEDQKVLKDSDLPLPQAGQFGFAGCDKRAHHGHSCEILEGLIGAGQKSVGGVDTGFLGEPNEVLNQVATDRFALIDAGHSAGVVNAASQNRQSL